MTSTEEGYNEHYIRLAQIQQTIDMSTEITEKIINTILQQDGLNYQVPANKYFETVKPHLIGCTALHLAARKRKLSIFKMLVEIGADFTIQKEDGETPLHAAMNFSVNTELGCCSLMGKLDHPYADIVLSAHLLQNIFFNPSNSFGLSHFHIACMTNNAKAVDCFLKNGVSVITAINTDSPLLPGFTPLHFAARYCSLEAAEVLLKYGANINTVDAVGQSPIHILLQRNIQIIDYTNMGTSPLSDVLTTEFETNKSIIKLIFNDPKMISISDVDEIGLSGLHITCTLQDIPMLQGDLDCEMINRAVKSNSPLWPGYTPLHFAAHFSMDAVKLLINRGADITAKDSKGMTPLDLCLQRYEAEDIHSIITSRTTWKNIQFTDGVTNLADFVLAMKCEKDLKTFLQNSMTDLNVSVPLDSDLCPGFTPLHLTVLSKDRFKEINDLYKNTDYDRMDSTKIFSNCMEENEDLYVGRIQLCLEFNADVTIKDASGSTPIHHAFYLQKEDIIHKLFEMHKKTLNPSNNNNLSHLHIACAMDDKISVEKFLRAGCDINSHVNSRYDVRVTLFNEEDIDVEYAYTITPGSTVLHIAVSIGNQDMCRLLINNGADVYAQESLCGFTPIHLSIVSDYHLLMTGIFSTLNLLPLVRNLRECTSDIGLTNLHVACKMKDVKTVKKLIKCGSKVDAAIAHSDLDESCPWFEFRKAYAGEQPVCFALNTVSTEILTLLLNHGADLLYKIPEVPSSFYRMLFASDKFDVTGRFYPMLKRDENLQSRITSDVGVTMLHFACEKLELDDVQELLRCGANPNAQVHIDSPFWPGYTPLHVLMKEGPEDFSLCIAVIELLIEYGADITLKNAEQNTPFHEAFMGTFLDDEPHEGLPIKAHKNFSVNPVNAHGISHFHLACYSRDVKAIKSFLKKGVDVNQPIDYFSRHHGGWTPLHFAAHVQCKEAVYILLRAGANANAQDTYTCIPLHKACTENILSEPVSKNILKMLIEAGSNLAAQSMHGETFLESLLKVENYFSPIKIGTLKLFFKQGTAVNIFNKVTNHGYISIMAINQLNDLETIQKHPFYKGVIDNPEINRVDHIGRTPIHNIISCSYDGLGPDEYAALIQGFVKVGIHVDHQDEKGRTALHTAFHFKNGFGIVGLLMNGIDVNLLDHQGKTAFETFSLQKPHPSKQSRHSYILRNIASHLYKLSLFEIYVSEANKTLGDVLNLSTEEKTSIMKDCQKEMKKLKGRTIDSQQICLADLLSESKLVAIYQSLSESQYEELDTIFRVHGQQLFNDYPNLVELLSLQYKKILYIKARGALFEPALVAFNSLVRLPVPNVCVDVIFRFLANDDLTSLISSVQSL